MHSQFLSFRFLTLFLILPFVLVKKQELPEDTPAEPVVPPGPEPGSKEWEYVEQPIDMVCVIFLGALNVYNLYLLLFIPLISNVQFKDLISDFPRCCLQKH